MTKETLSSSIAEDMLKAADDLKTETPKAARRKSAGSQSVRISIQKRKLNTERLQLKIRKELKDALQERAEEEGVSVNSLVTQILYQVLNVEA